jgi:hypothetical protein
MGTQLSYQIFDICHMFEMSPCALSTGSFFEGNEFFRLHSKLSLFSQPFLRISVESINDYWRNGVRLNKIQSIIDTIDKSQAHVGLKRG